MKFDVGELVYDPRHRKVGMIKTIKTYQRGEARASGSSGMQYGIHFFDDSYCAEGNTRYMNLEYAGGILERYKKGMVLSEIPFDH